MVATTTRPAVATPPGPKNPPLIGHLLPYRRDPLGFLLGLARRYGDMTYFTIGPRQIYLLNHPDLIKDVLVTRERAFPKGLGTELMKPLLGEGLLTSGGEFHLRQRRLVQPAFHRARVAAYGETMVADALAARARWCDGATVDIDQEMMRLTLTIVGRTLFSADIAAEAPAIGAALTAFMGRWRFLMLPYSGWLRRLPLPSRRRFDQSKAALDATIGRMIAERRADDVDRGDLLSMLLLARDAESGEGMGDRQTRDEAVTLLLAGHETTANALTWTWYLLSQHPEIAARLHAELDEVLAGRPPTVADVPRLRYTEMILAEALRLYPPAWATGRRASAACEIGGYPIPRGAVLIVSPYVSHHDPRFFPEPFRFDPERWTPEAKAGRPRFAYFPFGGGSRLCIGEAFAWMEGTLLLATLAQGWRMRLAPGHRVGMQPLITLRPRGGMRMVLERRA